MTEEIPDHFQELVATKAKELFAICDKKQKGFISRKDMQRLREELGVEPEQLEDVFDSLDADHDGYLTVEEFASGFSMFLTNHMFKNNKVETEVIEHNPDDDEEQQAFDYTFTELGAKGLYDDEETIKALWTKLRETDPILLRQFEQFIGKVTEEIKRSKLDHQSIEAALQNKSSGYDEEIKKLYEEMELQLRNEKAKIVEQEKKRQRELLEQVQNELHVKEQQLSEFIKKQRDLETKLIHVNLNEVEIKNDNDRLQQEKTLLEQQLQELTKDLEESRNYISQLQLQTKNEKVDRAKQTLRLTEDLVKEREDLVEELNHLRTLCRRLLDERDLNNDIHSHPRNTTRLQGSITKKYSVLSDYFPLPHKLDSEPEEDDESINTSTDIDAAIRYFDNSQSEDAREVEELGTRFQPIGAQTVFQHSDLMNVPPNAAPDRMFKIAFVGDSGVGKTSFIHRFCDDHFSETFTTTLGIDLQVKMLNIENRIVALQIWDTAGQERFRSITRQYLRKADGIVLIYDVTSEITFQNVRSWIASIRESTDDGCVVVLVGNKIDLCIDDEQRPVKYKDGVKIADEYQCLFYESSARLGTSIIEIMETMARLMQRKDDEMRKSDNTIQLSPKTKKTKCC